MEISEVITNRVLRIIYYLIKLGRRIYWNSRVYITEVFCQVKQVIGFEESFTDGFVKGINETNLPQILRSNDQQNFFVHYSNRENIILLVRKLNPIGPDLIITEAQHICEHYFDLLGSGFIYLGEKIDWHIDFKTNYRWNPKTYYRRIRAAPYPGGYDIKIPWELNQCQQFIRLGQAYWITKNEKYAHEFVEQVKDWVETNPWPWGVNWASTMEVAIRVVNWLWGYYYFRNSPYLTDEFLVSFYKSLLIHGRHIRKNLENYGGFTNNHYLANLVGLVFLGILCPEFKDANEWRDFGLCELWREMLKQVYPDGVNYEASIAYHRFATELFLSPIILCQLNNVQVPNEVMLRLEKMIDFVMHYTKPDGTVPLIGDTDNGRLIRLKVWDPQEREWLDHRYLLAIGAVLYERQDFAQAAGDQWEEAIWLLGETALSFKNETDRKRKNDVLKVNSHAFVDAGIFIMRQDDCYMILNAGSKGQNGNGGHAHNDDLSFEYFAFGQSWIIDPGTYVYTQDYNLRNLYRSTSKHNTIKVDGEEINHFDVNAIFQLSQDNKPIVNKWFTSDDHDFLDVEHHNYCNLKSPIIHKRRIIFDKIEKNWIIRDRLNGFGSHQFSLYFHFPKLKIDQLDDCVSLKFINDNNDHNMTLLFINDIKFLFTKENGWMSSSYGIQKPSFIAHYYGNFSAPLEIIYCFHNMVNEGDIRIRKKFIWNKYQDLLVNYD